MKSTTLYGGVIVLAAAAGTLTALQHAGAQTPQRNPPPRAAGNATTTALAVTPDPSPDPAPAAEATPAPTPPRPPRVRTGALTAEQLAYALRHRRSRVYDHLGLPNPEAPAPAAEPAAPPLAPTALVPIAAPTAPAPAPAAAPPTPAPRAETPLPVRPNRPIELAPARQGTGTGMAFLVVFVGAAVGLGYWLRRGHAAPTADAGGVKLSILQRASVGVRSELLVVDVAGQRLLLGVTPASVQHLAVLDGPEARANPADDAPAGDGPADRIGSRFEAMLGAARESIGPRESIAREREFAAREREPVAREREPERRTRSGAHRAAPRREVEEQARGLLALGGAE